MGFAPWLRVGLLGRRRIFDIGIFGTSEGRKVTAGRLKKCEDNHSFGHGGTSLSGDLYPYYPKIPAKAKPFYVGMSAKSIFVSTRSMGNAGFEEAKPF